MELFAEKVTGSIFQITLFAFIPFVWWLITARQEIPFTQWIGLKKIEKENRRGTIKTVICTTIPFFILSLPILYMLRETETATSDFKGMGINALPAAFVYAFFHTAFPEEILFRGFFLKRIKDKFGFHTANAVQSILFGSIHGIPFFTLVKIGMFKSIIITLFTGTTAWIMGYINEEKANGSILPGWIMHGLANIISAVISMFSTI